MRELVTKVFLNGVYGRRLVFLSHLSLEGQELLRILWDACGLKLGRLKV